MKIMEREIIKVIKVNDDKNVKERCKKLIIFTYYLLFFILNHIIQLFY